MDIKPDSYDHCVTATATGAATGTVTSSGNHASSHLAYLHQMQSKQTALAEGMLNLLQDLGMTRHCEKTLKWLCGSDDNSLWAIK